MSDRIIDQGTCLICGRKKPIYGVEPCVQCKSMFLHTGVMLIETTKCSDLDLGEITGQIFVVNEKFYEESFESKAPISRIAYVKIGTFESLGLYEMMIEKILEDKIRKQVSRGN